MPRNIIFDFGNVLFDLDLAAFEREMIICCGSRFAEAKAELAQEQVFECYETGGMSSAEFLERIALATRISPQQVLDAWNSIFIEMPAHRFDMLLRLRQQYQVFLLSNINALHEHWIAEYMLREHGLPEYQSRFFDGVYFSHLIRLRKPTPESFAYVLADAELMPGETVFFDDLPENVEAARLVGIHGVWHEPGTEIRDHLLRLNLLPK